MGNKITTLSAGVLDKNTALSSLYVLVKDVG